MLPVLVLAACATAPSVSNIATAPVATAPVDPATLVAPAQTISTAAATTDASAFVDAMAYAMLSAKSKTEVAGAQFNALQFGRVGAPRNWQGDGGQSYVKKGTACREADGSWTVSPAKIG
jgi:surface antigen